MSLSAWFKKRSQARRIKHATDAARIESVRDKAESQRQKSHAPHVVEYFHHIEDPRSHLAAQCLVTLVTRYNISLTVHLVTGKTPQYRRTPEGFDKSDSVLVAPYYNLEFAPLEGAPESDLLLLARAIIVSAPAEKRPKLLAEVGEAMWHSDAYVLEELAKEHGKADVELVNSTLQAGDERRVELGFCDTGSFYYGGEWYLHIDRLYHLENRLTGLGVRRSAGRQLVTPRPVLRADRLSSDHGLTLEVFLALNNPECAVAFARMQRLIRDSGVNLRCFPVRATQDSGPSTESDYENHRLLDLTREAHSLGLSRAAVACIPTAKTLDYALLLWDWARQQGKDVEFLSAYYNAVFFDGESLDKPGRWQSLIHNMGLPWDQAAQLLKSKAIGVAGLELEHMKEYEASGFQRFPLLRLRAEDGMVDLETVGHDRLWLVAKRMNNYNLYSSGGLDF